MSAALAEAHPALVADGPARDAKSGHLDHVPGALVVIAEAFVCGAHLKRPSSDLHPLRWTIHRF
jgi:hypothetical protein